MSKKQQTSGSLAHTPTIVGVNFYVPESLNQKRIITISQASFNRLVREKNTIRKLAELAEEKLNPHIFNGAHLALADIIFACAFGKLTIKTGVTMGRLDGDVGLIRTQNAIYAQTPEFVMTAAYFFSGDPAIRVDLLYGKKPIKAWELMNNLARTYKGYIADSGPLALEPERTYDVCRLF